MQSKKLTIIIGSLTAVVVVIIAIFAMHDSIPAPTQTAEIMPQNHNNGQAQNQSAQDQTADNNQSQAAPTITTNVGSVAGIDLSELATEANQSASLSSQDGSNDAKTISNDGQAINSTTDSVNNPIQ